MKRYPHHDLMATVTRVLPWRRVAAPVHTEIQGVDRYKARWPKSSADLLCAYEMADEAHQGQRRKSANRILHPVAVASVVAEMGQTMYR